MRDYSDYYAILGITPDTEWKELRARYRRLIGQWHPDRFSTDTTGRTIAEERSKEITLAYQALERYRRDHGVLPPLERVEPTPDSGAQARAVDASATAGAGAAPDTPAERPGKSSARRLPRVALFLAVLAAAGYVAQRYFDEPEPSDTEVAEAPPVEAPQRAPVPDELHGAGGIRVGSTLGEVYAIQGIPSSTHDEVWHYGKSWVRFEKGRVISWEEHVENPLRIDHHTIALLSERLFGVGSTKDEVRAIQGSATVETGNVWYYGSSKIYFERDLVVRWEESPMNPLRAAR